MARRAASAAMPAAEAGNAASAAVQPGMGGEQRPRPHRFSQGPEDVRSADDQFAGRGLREKHGLAGLIGRSLRQGSRKPRKRRHASLGVVTCDPEKPTPAFIGRRAFERHHVSGLGDVGTIVGHLRSLSDDGRYLGNQHAE